LAIDRSLARSAGTFAVVSLAALLAGCQGLARGGAQQNPATALAASPASLAFGDVVVGKNASQSATLRASGGTVSVSSVTASSGEFAVTGVAFPLTLAAGQSAGFTVTFTPQLSGAASATLTFASNADNAPTEQSASGNGTQAPQHSVDLSWLSSPTPGVVGYNVYRKSDAGFARINAALESSTSFTDRAVDAGATYTYAVTAVDGAGLESDFSQKAKAQIPTP